MNILLSKLFAGTFNDDNIGHEVINLFRQDNEKDPYHYLYIAPYGSVGSNNNKQCGFLDDESYKNINYIVFLSKTEINYVFKIIAVAKQVEIFQNADEINNQIKKIEFNHKNLQDLQFGIMDEEEIEEYFSDHYVSKITYKVKKDNYYDLREKNIYIYTYRNKNAKNNFEKNKNSFNAIYKDQQLHKLDFLPTWHNYKFMNNDLEFELWFKNNIENNLFTENKYNLLPVMENDSRSKIIYHVDNIINFMDKGNDENIITNMLRKILLLNSDLYKQFVQFLKIKADLEFVDGGMLKPIKQQSSLTEPECLILKYVNARTVDKKEKSKRELMDKFGFLEENISLFNKDNKPKKGYIDLFLEGDNFRFVLENKVKCGLNDVYIDDENNQLSQLDKYNKFLNYLDDTKIKKNNKIFIIAPDYHCVFNTGSIDCCVVKYSDLYHFFKDKEHFPIKDDYYKLFINAIAKHARTLDDVIKDRFIKITNET